MRGERRRWMAWGAAGLSLGAHLLAAYLAPESERRALPGPDAQTVELTVLEHPQPSSAFAEPTTESPGEGAPAPGATRALRAPSRRAARSSERRAVRTVDDPDEAVVEVGPDERPAVCDVLLEPESHPGCVPAPERPSIDTWQVIAPGEAARSELARAAREGAQDGPPDAGAAIGRALSADLARVANRTPHLSERPPPRLHRSSDGSYRYEGTPFDAVINPDGTVTFEDHRLDMPVPGVFTFDITDEAMRAAGQDPYQHERQWFMTETRELRDRLADEARERDRRRAMRRLEGRLATIWRDTSRPARERRRAIFDLWDDCAADDVGAQARRIVIRFVREHLPEGSADAYTAAELAALNADRVSPEPFAPYG